jgi:hypothetical protein
LHFHPISGRSNVANSDQNRKIWMRYEVADNGTVSKGRAFFGITAEKEDGLPDGMKVARTAT